MGCGSSRIGGTAVFPARLPTRRPHESDEDESCSPSQKYGTPLSEEKNIVFGEKCEKHKNSKLESGAGFQKNQTGSRDEFEDALADTCEDVNEDGDEDERMIGHEDDGAFPGSPSFRYFCKDGDENDLGKNYEIKSTMPNDDDDDDTVSKENYNDQKKQAKRGRRGSFKKVMPKGGQAAVKKLLSVKLRYAHSSSTRHP